MKALTGGGGETLNSTILESQGKNQVPQNLQVPVLSLPSFLSLEFSTDDGVALESTIVNDIYN